MAVKKNVSGGRKAVPEREFIDYALYLEIILWIILAFAVLSFISFFGVGGALGRALSDRIFGTFGILAYLLPFLVFFLAAFLIANPRSRIARIKTIAALLLYLVLCGAMQMVLVGYSSGYELMEYYEAGRMYHTGGGLIGGLILTALCPYLGTIGSAIILAFLAVILVILITQHSIFRDLRRGTGAVARRTRSARQQRRERSRVWREERAAAREEKAALREEKAALQQELAAQREEKLRERNRLEEKDSKAARPSPAQRSNEMKENAQAGSWKIRGSNLLDLDLGLTHEPEEESALAFKQEPRAMQQLRQNLKKETAPAQEEERPAAEVRSTRISGMVMDPEPEEEFDEDPAPSASLDVKASKESSKGSLKEAPGEAKAKKAGNAKKGQAGESGSTDAMQAAPASGRSRPSAEEIQEGIRDVEDQIQQTEEKPVRVYTYPDIELLRKPGKGKNSNTRDELMKTAVKLEEVLQSFGVNVTVTDVSCGPAVTRFEMMPAQGVKVNKILSLQNDIQLGLAAESLRIEAPIPGKSAIGIEIPNKEKNSVLLREVLESDTFRQSKARIPFGVGRDIAGKIIVSDIHKMPHLLVAGATGSGKSVFINTLILSILYKANPDEVKLIMVDPKVVELSVYNGIPHLLIPVVTDPKKAAGALNWAVAEMDRRYKLFSTVGAREIRGYNQHIDALGDDIPEQDRPAKLPMIVIIVDELADLMMVAGNDVEDAICRLTQLARAAGIHLVIATQRPSVDVITGLIKANMPSRIAFSVSSGTDSRTILDQVGAEKLLGNGDMLFFPQAYKQPIRVQGAFVDDDEVASVVAFLKENNGGEEMAKDLAAQMEAMEKSIATAGSGGGGSDQDELFAQAGRFIIEKDKASIGMLQRWFKIGFNRAARIMDQLSEAGVVGPEEGTKPRRVEMSMEQFENYLEQNG